MIAVFNPYKMLWTHIGGRPWTYIIRDAYHGVEFLVIVSLTSLGFFLAHVITVREFLTILAGFTIGYVLGHLFWGMEWIRGQKGGT